MACSPRSWLVLALLAGCGGGSSAPDGAVTRADGPELDGPGGGPDQAPAEAAAPDAAVEAAVGSCTVTPCGGDVVGSWDIGTTCYGPAPNLPVTAPCPRQTLDDTSLTTTGQLVLKSDMSYTLSLTNNGTSVLRYDTTCRQYTCDSLRSTLMATCSEASNLCTCSVPYQNDVQQESGTYRLEGQQVILKPMGANESHHPYCVSGSEMTMTTGTGAPGASDGVYRLTRK
jgi:hypothetical protein